MSKYRRKLPQLGNLAFLTDGGIETTMIFHDGFDMPSGEAFKFVETEEGRAWFAAYFRRYAAIALEAGMGFIFESPTWRANIAWGTRLGFGEADLLRINRNAIRFMAGLRSELETGASPMVLSGCIGPLGDGYRPDRTLTAAQAEARHGMQARAFAESEADMIAAITMTTIEEATGVARAAARVGMPMCVSFTVETDGRLPTGQTLQEAIETVDRETGGIPAYYMINCAHPTHFAATLNGGGGWVKRVRGLRANASSRSHAELDESPELDTGNPHELGAQYRALLAAHPHITVLGGCCGTDHRHVEAIGRACRMAA
jgi:S-methylmethionine-dependent homocysteine/selenocysteine methylase